MSRKYRQSGYQDSDRDRDSRSERRDSSDRPPRPQLTKEEKIQRRSLRVATSREANVVVRCHTCGRNAENLDTIEKDTVCPSCSSPLHCCRVCNHFDSGARWQCRASITEAVGDKLKANDCASYEPNLVLDATGRRSESSGKGGKGPTGPKAAFENLFKR
jgi:DNA-directed RNA polymerase subunit RPC12/RpoP